MPKVCHWEAGGRTGSARPPARASQQGFEMQRLQRVPCRQTIQFLEPNSLCPATMRVRSHLPIQKQEKTAQRVRRRFGLRQVRFFLTAGSCATSAPTRRHRDVESGQGVAYMISKCEVGLVTLLAQVGGYSRRDRFSLLVSPEPESDFAHTQQFCVCASPSQVGEQCDGSRYVSAQSHFRGMDGKSRKLESAKGVVNAPIFAADDRVVSLETQTKVDSDDPNGPRAPLRSNLDDPEEWELPCSDGERGCWDEAHRMELVSRRPIIKCGTTGCTGSCPTSVVELGIHLGRSQLRSGLVGKHSCGRTSLSQTSYLQKVTGKRETGVATPRPPLAAVETPLPPCLGSQAWWNDTPREQSEPNGEDAVIEDCTDSSGRDQEEYQSERQIAENSHEHAREHRVLIYGDSFNSKMQSLDDEKAASLAAKRQFGSKNKKNYLERVSKEIESKQKKRLEILQTWIEADHELDAANSKQIQA